MVRRKASICWFCEQDCASVNAQANYYDIGGGIEVVGTNRSHIVPYGRFGMAYWGMTGQVWASAEYYSASASMYDSSPALLFGGEVRACITHDFGIHGGVTALCAFGSGHSGAAVVPTVAVFFQK